MKRTLSTVASLALASLLLLASCGGKTEAAASTSAAPAAQTKLVFASDCTYPPMEYMNLETNVPEGFDIDLVAAIAKAGGFEYEVKNVAWNGIFAGLAAGTYDAIISSVNVTDDRKKTMDFSDAYLNAGQSIVVRKGEGAKVGTSLAELASKKTKVGCQISTTAQDSSAAAGIKDLKTYDAIGLAFEDLAAGRIDAVVSDEPICGDYANKKEQYKGKFEIVGEPFEGADFGIALNKGNSAALELINKGLAAIKADGTLDELIKKWFK
jgi:polar amino acid transport system substrate-binding protein